jgi:hypothetical protein
MVNTGLRCMRFLLLFLTFLDTTINYS